MAVKIITQAATDVPSAGTAVQVSSSAIPITMLIVHAPPGNTGNIYVGDSNVASDQCYATLVPGDTIFLTPAVRGRGQSEYILSDFYVDAATNGDDAYISYEKRR